MDDQVTELLASSEVPVNNNNNNNNNYNYNYMKWSARTNYELTSELNSSSLFKNDIRRLQIDEENNEQYKSNLRLLMSPTKIATPCNRKNCEYKSAGLSSSLLSSSFIEDPTKAIKLNDPSTARFEYDYSTTSFNKPFFNQNNLPNSNISNDRYYEPLLPLNGLFNPYECELQKKLSQLLTLEGKKREKPYFEEINDQRKLNENLFTGLIQCLEDYQLDINLYKLLNTQLKESLESYERQLDERKTQLESQYQEKSDSIRKDYELIIEQKNYEITELNNKLNQICLEKTHLDEIADQKVSYRDAKLGELRVNYETLEKANVSLQRELKETKSSLETMRNEHAQRKTHMEKLDAEKRSLQTKLTKLETDLRESESNSARVNSLLNEYKQSAESLSKQTGGLRQQLGESQKECEELRKLLREAQDAKEMLEIKCQSIVQEVSNANELRKTIKELQNELNQLKLDENIRSTEIQELKSSNKHLEMKISEVNSKNMELLSDKDKLIANSLTISNELNMMRENLKNSTTLIEHNCKVNSILKSEKEALDRALREGQEKLAKINSGHKKLKMTIKYLKQENDNLNSKQNSLNEACKNLAAEKDECIKLLDVKTAQIEDLKNLNNGQSQKVKERDEKCGKLEKSISLLEKEIGLLKQMQTLNTTEENSRVMRLVDSIQVKLDQKAKKIQELKKTVCSLKKENELLRQCNKIKDT